MTRRPRSVLFPGPMPLADKSPGTTRHLASDGRAAREKSLVPGVRVGYAGYAAAERASVVSMAFVSVREHARRRGITEAAVRKRLVTRGGPIPVHGRARQIDPDEADRLWRVTMSPAGASTSRFDGPPETEETAEAPTHAAAAAFL